MLALTPGTEHLLQILIILSAVLLIPVAVGLIIVLFKVAFLVHSTSEFVRVAIYELMPVVKELRLMVANLETMTDKAAAGMQELGNALHNTSPILKRGVAQVKSGTNALISGIARSFGKASNV